MGRYLMYAVGEVALVIIGIMIAVWLNNLNEARTQDEKIQAILRQVQNELLTTIEDSNVVIEYYRFKDSLIYLVMNDIVSEEDFKKPENAALRFISTNYGTLTIQNDGFNNLMQKSEVLPDKYSSIVEGLKGIYNNGKENVDDLNEELNDVVLNTIDHQRNNYDWYAQYYFSGGALTDEVLNYYINDINYRNSLIDFSSISVDNLLYTIIEVRIEAINYIREIDALLETENTYSFDEINSDYEAWIGTYHHQGDTIQIDQDEMGLKRSRNNAEWQKMYPLSKTSFHYSDNWFYVFQKDENGEIIGFTSSRVSQRNFWQKIEEGN